MSEYVVGKHLSTELLSRAAKIAARVGSPTIDVDHLVVAFAELDPDGLDDEGGRGLSDELVARYPSVGLPSAPTLTDHAARFSIAVRRVDDPTAAMAAIAGALVAADDPAAVTIPPL